LIHLDEVDACRLDANERLARPGIEIRDVPELEDAPERYVVWGEGTTDEMCLGIVMVTQPGQK